MMMTVIATNKVRVLDHLTTFTFNLTCTVLGNPLNVHLGMLECSGSGPYYVQTPP
jgi:hypothetical protein